MLSRGSAVAKVGRRWAILASAIFGPLFVLFWAMSGHVLTAAWVTALVFVVALVLIPFVLLVLLTPIAIHELGHLWAGRRAGYQFESLRIGPFQWSSRGRRTDWNVGLPLGLCEMRPPLGIASWRETLVFVAGGPFANLAAALAATLAFFLSGGRLGAPLFSDGLAGWVQFVATVALYTNAGTLVASLVPLRLGYVSSDGLQLLDLWRHRAR